MHQGADGKQCHARTLRRDNPGDIIDAFRRVVATGLSAIDEHKEIVLTPHDAFGHAGCPTGIEHQKIVCSSRPLEVE